MWSRTYFGKKRCKLRHMPFEKFILSSSLTVMNLWTWWSIEVVVEMSATDADEIWAYLPDFISLTKLSYTYIKKHQKDMNVSKNHQYLVCKIWQKIGKRCAEVSVTDIMFTQFWIGLNQILHRICKLWKSQYMQAGSAVQWSAVQCSAVQCSVGRAA